MAKEIKKKEYDFGEKKEENINGKKIPVEFHTPKYKEAKKKIIELLESDKYKNVLEESDFWILVNTYSQGTKAMYSGLIISHDGCLKINDSLEEKLKFKPECMTIDKDGYKDSLVFSYVCPEQGIYEVGEVSKDNCKNNYPYAMALKRCMDRVILKNSKIAYSGVYSDSEADEFTNRVDESKVKEEKTKEVVKQTTKKTTTKEETKKEEPRNVNYKILLINELKRLGLDITTYMKENNITSETTQEDAKKLYESLKKVEVGGNK